MDDGKKPISVPQIISQGRASFVSECTFKYDQLVSPFVQIINMQGAEIERLTKLLNSEEKKKPTGKKK